jgi:hypothetical protein
VVGGCAAVAARCREADDLHGRTGSPAGRVVSDRPEVGAGSCSVVAASRRSKGWGKSPVEAAKAIAELAGPVRFAGWDSHGEPVGRPWGTASDPPAWVQIAAVSEDQTENTHSVVYEFLTANDGRAADVLKIDAGLTRSYLRDGNRKGKLEPVTAAPVLVRVSRSRTRCWTRRICGRRRNGGVRLARTLRRNVAKMGGRTYETTNSFEPGERSVAERRTRRRSAALRACSTTRSRPPN